MTGPAPIVSLAAYAVANRVLDRLRFDGLYSMVEYIEAVRADDGQNGLLVEHAAARLLNTAPVSTDTLTNLRLLREVEDEVYNLVVTNARTWGWKPRDPHSPTGPPTRSTP